MSEVPIIVQDRTQADALEGVYPHVISQLKYLGLGKIESKRTVHFCGLLWAGHTSSCIFVPRKSLSGNLDIDRKTAMLTMQVLAMYGREMANRSGIRSFGDGNTGLLATISELTSDYLRFGIVAERIRFKTRNSGKPVWSRTFVREMALIGKNGSLIYPNIQTTRAVDSNDVFLACVQASVLLEIAEYHSWWLPRLRGKIAQLKQYKKPNLPRSMWVQKLRLTLPDLFVTRTANLAKSLIAYLEDTRARDIGNFSYGLEDFEVIWEHMLRSVLWGVEEGWNSRLPRPAYVRSDSSHDVLSHGMRTDIVLRHKKGLKVVDAKYYDADRVGRLPSLPDIVKQMFYVEAVRSVAPETDVGGCFVFPAETNNYGPYSEVAIFSRDSSRTPGFPYISCHYLNITEVMRAYIARQLLCVRWE